MHWTKGARILSDPPEKTQRGERERWLINTLGPAIAAAEADVRITTAYFVPGTEGVEGLCGLAGRGPRVSVLTNSLASTNQVTVHGGYAEARPKLLRCGVRLFELRPRNADRAKSSLFGSTGASLHTKNFSVDGRLAFIGSFNFDLRSAYLNTEMGLLVDDPAVAAEIDAIYFDETSAGKSYEVTLEDGALRWRDGGRVLNREPEASRDPPAGGRNRAAPADQAATLTVARLQGFVTASPGLGDWRIANFAVRLAALIGRGR